MRRAAVISGSVLLALLVLVAGAFYFLFKTPPGLRLLASMIETPLGDAIGGEARIGALSGDLPSRIVLENVEFRDEDGAWLFMRRTEIVWRPLSLLKRAVNIDVVQIDGAEITRAPPPRPQSDREPRGMSLPEDLPKIRIGLFQADDVVAAPSLTGQSLRFDGSGALEMGGKALLLRFEASDAQAQDYVSLTVDIDPGAGRGFVDATIASTESGAIARLSNLDGPLYAEAKGDGPLDAFAMDFHVTAGSFGRAQGRASGDLDTARSVNIEANAVLGAALTDVAAEIGSQIALQATLSRLDDGMALRIEEMSAAPGRLQGAAAWRNRRGVLQRAEARAIFAPAPEYREEIQSAFGASAEATLNIVRAGGAYLLDGALATPTSRISFKKARSDLRETFSAHVFATMEADATLSPLLHSGLNMRVDLALEQDSIRAAQASITLGDGSTLSGNGAFDRAEETAIIEARAGLKPSTLSALVPRLAAAAPLDATIRVKGPVGDLAASITASTPALTYGDAPFPAAAATIDISGLTRPSSVRLEAVAADRSRRIAALALFDEANGVAIRDLAYVGAGFRLTGEADFVQGATTLKASYSGQDGAEPWPGTIVEGDLSVNGVISANGTTDLDLSGRRLKTKGAGAEAFQLTLSGPPQAVAAAFTADAMTPPGLPTLTSVSARAAVDLKEQVLILRSLDGALGPMPFALSRRATLTFSDEVEIANFRLAVGRDGTLALDGAFTAQRWRATAQAEQITIDQANSVVAFDLDLDTDRDRAATGTFRARSLLLDDDAGAVGVRLAWEGAVVRLTDDDRDSAVDLDVALPLRLRRGADGLSVDLEGPISGRAAFDGAVQSLAPYLPPALQSVEGALAARVTLSGTLDQPLVSGSATLTDASYTELSSGLSIVGINGTAEASARNGGARIEIAARARGPGQSSDTISANGAVDLGGEAAVDIRVSLDGARFAAYPVTSSSVSGVVELRGAPDALTASGALTVAELNAEVITPPSGGLVPIEVVSSADAARETEGRPIAVRASPLTLAIDIEADDRIFVRGRGLDSEWRASVEATGDAARPVLIGRLDMRRGRLDFAGRRFEVTRGQISFDSLSENNPALDIRAEHQADEILAAIEISGRARSPIVTLTSTPERPRDDVMALVLFGKPATDLSALESLQVAQALTSLGGIGPFGGTGGGVAGSARRALGLDMLNLDLDEDAASSSIEIGKYVADGVFVSATQDARGERGAVRLQYEITPSITVETELRQDGDQTVSANWKRDF